MSPVDYPARFRESLRDIICFLAKETGVECSSLDCNNRKPTIEYDPKHYDFYLRIVRYTLTLLERHGLSDEFMPIYECMSRIEERLLGLHE